VNFLANREPVRRFDLDLKRLQAHLRCRDAVRRQYDGAYPPGCAVIQRGGAFPFQHHTLGRGTLAVIFPLSFTNPLLSIVIRYDFPSLCLRASVAIFPCSRAHISC
jgi:hypothetical protein